MNNVCSGPVCPIILDSTCVFYSGANLVYTGIRTNDSLQVALVKIDNKFRDAGLGYVFQNGLVQTAPGAPVKIGGSLIEDTVVNSDGFNLTVTGRLVAGAHATSGGTSSQFVKGDGSLDNSSYQPAGNYITALTGDGTASGPGSAIFTLDDVSALYAGTWGNATTVPRITLDTKGRVTSVTNTPINLPPTSLVFVGDVYGAGPEGTNITLTIDNVLSSPGTYGSNTKIPTFTVNSKGQITSISEVTVGGGTGTVTSVSVTPGTGISASVANPTTTPNITITNTAPDQTVVLNNGTGINVTGTYPNFTISATGTGSGTLVALPFTTDHLAITNNQYAIGDLVWYLGDVYRCIANNDSLTPSTSPLYWTNLGAGYPLVQQPIDWNSTSGNNQILNKPTIPTNIVTGTGTATRVAFWNTTSSLSSDSSLYWDNVNKRLGVGGTPGAYTLEVLGSGFFNADLFIANQSKLIFSTNSIYIRPELVSSVYEDLAFYTNNSEKLRIKANGDVVIGTLGGVGTRMVVASSTGVLSTQAIPTGTVTGVTATSPITSSGGTAPVISTSMATNKLIGRSTAGVGVMEEITVGTGLSLSGGTLNATAQVPGFEMNFLLMGA